MKFRWGMALLGIWASSVFAAEQPAAEVLTAKLDAIKTFSARFEQHIKDAKDNQISYAKGRLVIQRPGKFYWEGLQPDRIIVIADGKTLWNYDVELEQVTRQPLKDALARSPAGLFVGDMKKFNQEFDIAYAELSHCVTQAEQCYHLLPKEAEKDFTDIYLSMRGPLFIAIKMHDQLDQTILTEFTAIKTNAPIDETLFKFTPPQGVDVIETKGS